MIKVKIEESAQKDLDKLAPVVARQVLDKLETLEKHPEPHTQLTKLTGYQDLYRLHFGPAWVAVGVLKARVLRILWVDHRSQIYKRLRRR